MRRLGRSIDSYELVRLLPSAGVVVVWTVLMFQSGGFRPESWLPAGLVLAGLLVAGMVGARRALPDPGASRWALLALVGFTAWCYLSLLWSDAPGLSWEASNLLLVATLAAWVLAIAPWRAETAMALMLAVSFGAAVVCLVRLVQATGATDLTDRFAGGRFTGPLDYSNTSAAFAFMAAIPPLVVAARPDGRPLGKGLAQGLATFLAAYALLPQSRGAILGGVATLVVLAVMVPFRWRLALHGALLALGMVIASRPAHDLFTAAFERHKASGELDTVTVVIVLVGVLAVPAGAALAAAGDSVQLDRRGRRRARWAGYALAGVFALGVAGVAVANSGTISDELHDQWRSLSHPGVDYAGDVADQASGRLSSIDPLERYDYWRVSADGFRAAPLWGMGAGGFEYRYTLDRRYPKVARYPHNLFVKVAGDTGLVGIVLIGGFLVLVLVALVRNRGRLGTAEAAVAAGAAATFGYFLAHGFFDWLEAYPVLLGPALGFPLVALVVRARQRQLVDLEEGTPEIRGPAARRYPQDPRRRLPGFALGALAGLLVVYALAAPWLSLRYRDRASDEWRGTPGVAYADLRKAADLDPLSSRAYVLQGVIALTRGDLDIAEAGWHDALDRQRDWLPHFGLAVVAAARGDQAKAEQELDIARDLNRHDPNLPRLRKQILSGKKPNPAQLIRDVLISPLFEFDRVS